jgi:hypothetical protein
VADVGRELDYFDPEAVVMPLIGTGLVHKTSDGFVLAAPAAFRMVQMVDRVV